MNTSNNHKNNSEGIDAKIQQSISQLRNQTAFQVWLTSQKNLEKSIIDIFYNLEETLENYSFKGETSNITEISNFTLGLLRQGRIDFLPPNLRQYASDCFIILQNFEAALQVMPRPALNQQSTMVANRILTLRYLTKTPFDASEILMLFGPKVTRIGSDYLNSIYRYLNVVIPQGEERCMLLNSWASNCSRTNYQLFNGTQYVYFASKRSPITEINFSGNTLIQEYVNDLTRTAENVVREERGLPRVGEGWVSETKLYFEISNAFQGYKIIQHATPSWLGNQHLDVYLPELNVALEYQGLQHDQAVDFFGGEESFQQTRMRDLRKLRICKKHGVRIIYVRPGYSLPDIIAEVKTIK
jgi:hypothetical protein